MSKKQNKRENFYPLTVEEYLLLRSKLKANELDIYLYLAVKYPFSDLTIQLDTLEISKTLRLHRRNVQKALKKLNDLDLLPEWLDYGSRNNDGIESQIRDRLQLKYNCLKEVTCPAGRIDLLSCYRIVEIKNIKDWKTALGQILVYSAYYPEHIKQIHLFGQEKDKEKLPDIEMSCIAFAVMVSFEVVGGDE